LSFILQQDQLENTFSDVKEFLNQGNETISTGYRGYNWSQVPVPTHLQLELPFNQIGYDYCSTGRYLFLNKVENETATQNFSRILGKATDHALLGILKNSISYISNTRIRDLDAYSYLHNEKESLMIDIEKELIKKQEFISIKEYKQILSICEKIISYEISNIISRISYHVSKVASISSDTLRQRVIPLYIEPQISATDMGFSDLMTPDFHYPQEKAIGDFKNIKYNRTDLSYKIAMAGYALAYESTTRNNIDLGFILHLDSLNKKLIPIYHLDVFVINNAFRKNFIDKRNYLLNLVSSGQQGLVAMPKLPPKCPKSCPYIPICNPVNIDENK